MILHRLFIFLTIICLFACQNAPKTPNTVSGQGNLGMQEDFAKRYPNIPDVIWDTLDMGFTASFSDDVSEHSAHYDTSGVFQYAVTFIEQTALPIAVQQVIAKKYKNAATALVMRVEKDKTQTYQI